ncbi:MAG: sigma-54 dependent transcriptional regulator [Phycisphaerae bacterium]|nr:sigma-54 dependent transcriptional regulator [Phycisphaerae bacterium]
MGDASAATRGAIVRSEFVIGTSDAFNSILQTINTVASRQCPMIISGETGAGKEMVARQIHLCSDRADRVFVPVDCTTLTGQLFESQLFGHVRGAFTGAISDTLGFFRAADGGTIFLDEISEIPLDLQAKLLRVLQESTVTPVGSVKSFPIDIRVLCATNRNLKQLVDGNKFRADLYYRLNVITIHVPPIRERPQDVLALAEYFLARQAELYNEPYKTLAEPTKKLLLEYHWPGNVRELANVIERAYVLTNTEVIPPAALPAEILIAAPVENGKARLLTLNEAQRKVIIQALETTGGKKIAAAKILGLERRKLNRLLEKLDISLTETE